MDKLRNLLILLLGSFLSFILASQINNLLFLPDPQLTSLPFILAPLIISVFTINKSYIIDNHRLLAYTVIIPFSVLFLGFYLFAFVLRNLR